MRLRAIVALARAGENAQLLLYARQLADCGLLREVRFLHVLASDCEAARKMAEQDAIEAEVQQYFGTPEGRIVLSCHIEQGELLDTLLERTHAWHSDLILLEHRNKRSGQRSLARRLAMISPCSVWLVPEGAPLSLSRVLAPVDFSEHAADGLATALDVARAASAAECVALHVFFDESLDRSSRHKAKCGARETQAFEQFLRGIDTSGVSFDTFCEESPHPAQSILRVARTRETDLIVMNTRGRSRAASILLGSVTTEVMIGTSVPILAVKHFGAMMGLFAALKESQFWNRKNPKTN